MSRAVTSQSILPVILAGGMGTRLAPISTPEQPKPFLPLADGQSLLTRTLMRVADSTIFAAPLLVGHASHRFALLNHARAARVTPQAILLEPAAKNTAMAIAAATAYALQTVPDALLAILPADHHIAPVGTWQSTLREAAKLAADAQKICLLGVTPTAPDPNFGYLQLSVNHEVLRFIEKPAQPGPFLAHSLWNAGQFIAPARVFAALFTTHLPDLWRAAQQSVAESQRDWEFTRLAEVPYQTALALSFDRAIIERSPALALRLQAEWHDLGTLEAWQAYGGEAPEIWARRPKRIDRPWGYYELLAETPGRLEKRLTIFPGCRLSLQRHRHREEEWHILSGIASIQQGNMHYELHEGGVTEILADEWHRLQNQTENLLIIHEIQVGKPDEDDIERLADDYGRI